MVKIVLAVITETESYHHEVEIESLENKTDLENAIMALEKVKQGTKIISKFQDEVMQKAEQELGLEHHWQDSDGTVYVTARPDWKSIKMDHFSVERTRFPGESKGSLSMVKARELGYTVEGK